MLLYLNIAQVTDLFACKKKKKKIKKKKKKQLSGKGQL